MTEERGFTVRDRRGAAQEEPRYREAGTGRSPFGASREAARGLPPVDFTGFILGLGQMALVHLGEVPEPATGEVRRDLEQARHTIDLLDMLEAKTKGNLTPEEERLLRGIEEEIKFKYVRIANQG